jgi:hypothetical protein
MEILLLWILCGVIAAIIGAKKGEGFLAFIVGILLGPFGILAAIASKGKRKQCQFCKELIHKDATVCSHCQREDPIPRLTVAVTPRAPRGPRPV